MTNSRGVTDPIRQAMKTGSDLMPLLHKEWDEADRKWLEDTNHFLRGLYLKYAMKKNVTHIAVTISEIMENLEKIYGASANKRLERNGFRVKWVRERPNK